MSAEAPLLLVVEIEPTETVFFPVGGSFRFHLNIVLADSKQQQDPDTLSLIVSPQYGTPTTYTLISGGTIIVKNSVGNYQADIAIGAAGKLRAQYVAGLNSINCGSNTTEVYGVSTNYW